MKNVNDLRPKFFTLLLTAFFLLLSYFGELKAQTRRNCSEIHFFNPAAQGGIYVIDPDGTGPMPPMDCQCDMTTDGGGWTLVLNYNHLENTGPELKILTNILPLQGQTILGIDESNTAYWGHAGVAVMTALPFDEIRFYGITSDHARVMDFKTSHSGTISYFKTGIGSTEGISTNFSPLAAHSAYLPAAINMSVSNQGDYAMTAYPLWTGATYHWYLGGPDPNCTVRWEVDNYPCSYTPSSFHQIWVRQNAFLGIKTERQSEIEIKISPNPFRDITLLSLINITPESFNYTQINIYNTLGEQVYPLITRNSGSFTIAKGALSPGIYICQLVNEKGVLKTLKMVIE